MKWSVCQKLGKEVELERKPSATACESNVQRIQSATDEESSLFKRSLISFRRFFPCLHHSFSTPFSFVHIFTCEVPLPRLWRSNSLGQISLFSNRKKWSLLSPKAWPVLINFLCACSPFPYQLSGMILQLVIHLTWTMIHYGFQFNNIP